MWGLVRVGERGGGTNGGEVLLESLVILLLEGLHELGNVSCEKATRSAFRSCNQLERSERTSVNVVLERLGIELLGLGVVTRESVLGMRNEDSSVRSTLHRSEDTGTGRGTLESDVEEALERPGTILDRLGELESSIGLRLSLVLVGEAELGESAASDEKSGGVGCRESGVSWARRRRAERNAPAAQLVRPCSTP